MAVIDLKPDLDVIERWVRYWPGIPVLVAIDVHPVTGVTGKITGANFAQREGDEPDIEALLKWIVERQGGPQGWANLYFHPNALMGPIGKKAEITDVRSMNTLHVDSDVAPGEDQELGITRIVGLLKKLKDKDGNPALPTDIVTSGGGAQAYWRLGSPVPVNGSPEIAEDLALYNVAVKLALRGDDVQSLDHVMRLPGTVNVPNEKKIGKGRKPRVATWVFHDDAQRYSLSQFIKAPAPDKAAMARANSMDYEVTWTQETVSKDDPRLTGLSAEWKRIGIEGDTKNEYLGADGKTDRSNMAFAFVTACMRSTPLVVDDVIRSILMDKGWVVGACIRDKGATQKRHLNRIIERARKFVAEDMSKPAVLGTDKWAENAVRFLQRRFPNGLVYWRGEFYYYKAGVWLAQDEEWMRSEIWKFLRDSLLPNKLQDDGTWSYKPFNPANADVNELYNATKNMVLLATAVEQPAFLNGTEDDYPPPRECINLRNGILHVPTKTLIEHTQDFFSSSIAEFDYEPRADCPVWRSTLDQYWPDAHAEEPTLLQEMFGYSLTPWTALQKILAVVGPGRSGKGTLARVLTLLVGKLNIASPTFRSLGGDFGRQSLINKLLAIVGEAAFGARDDRAEITNFLKTVSGEDSVTIQRKYLTDWEGRMIARFWLFCNQIPDFLDAGKALMARIVPLRMTRSFADNPDTKLGDKLEDEISGILNWALAGFDRLLKNDGNFTMPEASVEVKDLFGSLASPLTGFLDDACDMWDLVAPLDKDMYCSRDDLYTAYLNWCDSVSIRPKSLGKAMEAILSLEPAKLKMTKKNPGTGARFVAITGLKLKEKPKPRNGHSDNRHQGRHTGSDLGKGAARDDEIPF